MFLLKSLRIISFLAIFIIIVGIIYAYWRKDQMQATNTLPLMQINGDIGGTFTLYNQDRKQASLTDFQNHYILLYFGYTYCPDVCPTELHKMLVVEDYLPQELKDKIKLVMITIDPERDTPEVLQAYRGHFNDKIEFLWGTPQEVKQVATLYKTYFQKAVEKEKPDEAYLVDHSSFIYLLDPKGAFLTMFHRDISAELIAKTILHFAKEPL